MRDAIFFLILSQNGSSLRFLPRIAPVCSSFCTRYSYAFQTGQILRFSHRRSRWHPGRRRRGRRRPHARARALPGIRIRRRSACSWLQFGPHPAGTTSPVLQFFRGGAVDSRTIRSGWMRILRACSAWFPIRARIRRAAPWPIS